MGLRPCTPAPHRPSIPDDTPPGRPPWRTQTAHPTSGNAPALLQPRFKVVFLAYDETVSPAHAIHDLALHQPIPRASATTNAHNPPSHRRRLPSVELPLPHPAPFACRFSCSFRFRGRLQSLLHATPAHPHHRRFANIQCLHNSIQRRRTTRTRLARWWSLRATNGFSSSMHPVSLRRRNVGMLFSRKDRLEYVLMRYKISILSFLQTIHPKKYTKIFYRRRLP